jgi:hypothetical protein
VVAALFVVLTVTGDRLATAAPARDARASDLTAAGLPQVPAERHRGGRGGDRVYKARIDAHWFADNTCFWYRNDLRDGKREFIVVDAVRGLRQPAFDHRRLAEALRKAGPEDVAPDRLPLEALRFESAKGPIFFRTGDQSWRCDLQRYDLQKVDRTIGPVAGDGLSALARKDVPRATLHTGPETELTFVNRTEGDVELFWLDRAGRRRSYGKVAAGRRHRQHTFAGHVWVVVDGKGIVLAVFQAPEAPTRAEITGKVADYRRQHFGERAPEHAKSQVESPNGEWTTLVKDDNAFVRSRESNEEIQLSQDGGPENTYAVLEWAPDSKTLVAFRVEPGDRKEVYVIQSSPPGSGRAVLHTRPYALPGDKFDCYELNLFEVASRRQLKPEVERIDFGRPRLRWNRDGRRFTYEKTDRGHQRFRLIEVDSHTGTARHIIDEKTDTFIWTAHTESVRLRKVNWVGDTDEIIYVSERDGWRHLYLVDAEAGKIKCQTTKGDYVVRAIDRVDEEQRQIWFRASGKNSDQDPYFMHYYRVNFDGSDLVALTGGNGYHSAQYSPDRKYLIDTYSRVDMAPVHELRRTSDGQLVCELERTDISQLVAGGWESPEVFVAKGRDGKTDIWGIICRPRDFNPQKKYPVIEDIYAGPHSAYAPKRFNRSRRYASLTDLGFIVVKIDGMGTAHRSKAFHDVCWKNLKDAGLPDRVLWMKEAAK